MHSLQYGSNLKVSGKPTVGVFVFRRVQEGHHGELVITRERRHLAKSKNQIAIMIYLKTVLVPQLKRKTELCHC